MRISDLRRKVHEKGLEVDGSREAMIAALEGSSCSLRQRICQLIHHVIRDGEPFRVGLSQMLNIYIVK